MIGSRLAHYDITGHLGSGGMGDVYQATDSKLGRSVAIKLLPEAFARDADRAARFEREARVLASLNHPHIAAIYGLEESGGRKFLVMELVGGETLAERIKRGPIPLNEALEIAKQIAEALEAAHDSEKGIIHRDLKPANVKITPEGQVKVLDFGLAKAYEPESANANLSNSPTLSMAATNAGVILGTAAYMSPEQAKGRVVDRRTDIFAFGGVLYEMLTGRPAFEGDDITEILGRVVTAEPDWNRLPARTSASVNRLLRRALKKDPRQRLGDIRDARLEIEEALSEPSASSLSATAAGRGARLAWLVTAASVLMAAVFATINLRETPAPSPPEMRVEINTPYTSVPLRFALSPDGRHIVFVASGDGPQRLWLRSLDRIDAQPMAGTEGAQFVFWSPDSRSIGFNDLSRLYRVDIAGGKPQALADGATRGGAWNADGTILFARSSLSPLFRIPASGGEPVAITRLDPPRQTDHRFPQFLPDGRHFLFYAAGSPDASGIYLGSLEGGESKRLTASDTAGAYLPLDWIVFMQQGVLVARRLDSSRGELTGDPVTLADPVGYDAFNQGGFSVSADGRVAYRGGGAVRRVLSWFDRTGKTLGLAGEPDANNLLNSELSPDDRHVAVTRTVQNNGDIWLMDFLRGGFTRFTFDAANDNVPLWSPDGTRIAFQSRKKDVFDLFVKPTSGTGPDALLLETPYNKQPQDWSSDGRVLLYNETGPKGRDLLALELTDTERKPLVVADTNFEERSGEFSPDGRWVAYETNESGRFEIVVQSFPAATARLQVSIGGGTEPRWRADGRELFFISFDEKLMAVPITASGPRFEAGTPVVLFSPRMMASTTPFRPRYAVSRDGRFLINQPVEESVTSPITLILNWKPPAN